MMKKATQPTSLQAVTPTLKDRPGFYMLDLDRTPLRTMEDIWDDDAPLVEEIVEPAWLKRKKIEPKREVERVPRRAAILTLRNTG